MERSGWGTKSNQTRILAVRISRAGWDAALEYGVLTGFEPKAHSSVAKWQDQFQTATVHVQWDPERSIYGKKLDFRAIQVGLSRTLIDEYVSVWIKEVRDLTETTAKIRSLRKSGHFDQAKRLLPKESVYPVAIEVSKRLGMEPPSMSR